MKITFKDVIFTLIFGALIFSFGLWQGHEQCKKELKLQKAGQDIEKKVAELLNEVEEAITKSKGLTLHLSDFPKSERDTILKAAKRNNLKTDLLSILFAIRKAENGSKRREFGIIHPRCEAEMDKRPDETLDIQAGWAAARVQKNYDRWIKAGSKGRYIVYLACRFCPVGAANDPDGLNKNWIGNVNSWVEKIRG